MNERYGNPTGTNLVVLTQDLGSQAPARRWCGGLGSKVAADWPLWKFKKWWYHRYVKLPDHKLLKTPSNSLKPIKILKTFKPKLLKLHNVFQRWADTPGLNLAPAADCADDAVQQQGFVVLAQQPKTSRAGSSWVNGWTFTSNKWRRTP